MNGIRHPFTGALYEPAGGGMVRVTEGDRTGLFAGDGRWLSGELRACDPQLCGWIAGPRVLNSRVAS